MILESQKEAQRNHPELFEEPIPKKSPIFALRFIVNVCKEREQEQLREMLGPDISRGFSVVETS